MVLEDTASDLLTSSVRSVRWIALWSVFYGLVALISLVLSDAKPGQVVIWLANPVGAVVLLRLPRKQWPVMLAAILATGWTAHIGYAWAAEPERINADTLFSTLLRAGLDVPLHLFEIVLTTFMLSRTEALQRAGDHAAVQAKVLLRAVLVPTAIVSALSAWVWGAAVGSDWQLTTLNWFSGHIIGAVAAMPLALTVATKRPRFAWEQVSEPLALFMLFGCVAVTLWAGSSLPQPLVFMVVPMVWMAARTNLVAALTANVFIAASMSALIRYGILLAPPTSSWWGDALFYLSVLATLLPGLFLAVMSEGQRKALKVLAESELRAKELYVHTPAMLHSINTEGRIVQVSNLWLVTLGYSENTVLGKFVTEFMTPDSAIYAREVVIPAALRDGHCTNIEYEMRKLDGSICDVILSAIWEYDSKGRPLRSLAVLQDVTEKKRLEARSHFAEHDPLTGLPNRVLLQDRLKMLCAHHLRHGGHFAVGYLDLDHFKEINDKYGHDAGDELLKQVASRMKGTLRSEDTVCRVGGDEFVILLSSVESAQDLQALAEKTMQAVAVPCKLGDSAESPVVTVSGSIGLAVFPANGLDPQTLLTHADQAMYSAKRSGRNRCALYRANSEDSEPFRVR